MFWLMFYCIVVFWLTFHRCIATVYATCDQPIRSSMVISMSNVNVIRATELVTFPLTSIVQCGTQCLNIPSCYYIIIDETNKTCSIYQTGLTTFDVSKPLTYVVESKKMEVISLPVYSVKEFIIIITLPMYVRLRNCVCVRLRNCVRLCVSVISE